MRAIWTNRVGDISEAVDISQLLSKDRSLFVFPGPRRLGTNMSENDLEALHRAIREMRDHEVIRLCDRLLENDPANAEILYYKGQAMANLDRFEEAVKLFDETLQLTDKTSGNFANIMVAKGNTLLMLERLDEAETCYDQALSIKPFWGQVWVERARVAFRRQRFQDSVKYCDRAISIDSSDARAWNSKAFALLQLSQLDQCIECAQKAISIKSDYTAPWICMGQAYERKGQANRARECFEKAQRLGQAGMRF